MKAIWKYEIIVADTLELTMPQGAKIIAFQVQRNIPCIWAIVDIKADLEQRKFRIIGTGHKYAKIDGKYLGTIQLQDGYFIGHLFEEE